MADPPNRTRPAAALAEAARSTDARHLGNNRRNDQDVAGQERGDPSIYWIVDLHSITVVIDPAMLR